MMENLRAGRAPVNSFDGRLTQALLSPLFSRRCDWRERNQRTLSLDTGCSWRRRLAGGFSIKPDTSRTPAPQNRPRNRLRAVHTVDPGKSKGAFLCLDDNVISSLEAIVVILVHSDMLDPPPAAPRSDQQAAAARQSTCCKFPDHCRRNSNWASSVQLAIQKKQARKNPRHRNHPEVNALDDFDFLASTGSEIDPVTKRERKKENEARKYQYGIQLQGGKHLASRYEHNDANKKESRAPHQPPA